MLDTRTRKDERRFSGLSDTLSARQYNFVIGACIAYGFVINAIMVATMSDFFINMKPTVFVVGYFVCAIAGCIITVKSNNPLLSFIGYNMVVVPFGATLAVCLPSHTSAAIFQAAIVTGVVVVVMTILATIFPSVFARMGRALFISLIVLVIVQFLGIFVLGYTGTLFNWAGAILFTLYIGYDWHVAQSFPKTMDNAIDSACDLYMDIIILFKDILNIIDR